MLVLKDVQPSADQVLLGGGRVPNRQVIYKHLSSIIHVMVALSIAVYVY